MTDNELLLAISDLMDRKLKSELQAELQPIKDEIAEIKGEIAEIKGEIAEIKGEMVMVKGEITTLKDEMATVKNKIISIECEIDLLKNDQAKTNLMIENVLCPGIQLLKENYVPASKRYMKESARIESMEADIKIMKKVLCEHSEKLQKIS